MSSTCFWRFVLLSTTIISVVHAATTLYCVSHKGALHSLDTCNFSTLGIPISAAILSGNATISPTKKMSFDLTCKAPDSICDGVSATFSRAMDIINSAFKFETPLLVNATFLDFCQAYNDCGFDGKMTSIGQAYPAISYIMVDSTDNMTRMYPQPLLKQFINLSVKPQWTKYDINAQFNTQMNWYFSNNPNPINANQTDFLRNVLHELTHGLGFITSWTDDLYREISPLFQQQLSRFITPILLASADNEQLSYSYDAPQPFWGFVEFPFDKFIQYQVAGTNASTSFTNYTNKLNTFGNSNVIFRNLIDLANSWYSSDAYQQAVGLYNKTVTSLDVLAVINENPILWLETSLSPYTTGSSLCHVDQSKYLNTTEYLMVYAANRGTGIDQLNQQFPSGPFGQKLPIILANLGYNINNYQGNRPKLSYWSPPPGLVGTSSNPSPSLTIDTNGPAQSPNASVSSTKSAFSPSSSISDAASSFNYSFFCIISTISLLFYVSLI